MSKQVLNIPDLGEAEDVEVIEICVKPGDIVNEEDPIIVLESEKAAMEIPTSLGGKVLSIKVSVGDKVSTGSPFLEIEGNADIKPFLIVSTYGLHKRNSNQISVVDLNLVSRSRRISSPRVIL